MKLNTYIIKLDKNKHSITSSEKYKINNCQDKIEIINYTTKWIKLNEIFKNYLFNEYNIIIKIGTKDSITKEFIINEKIKQIPGFINYLCYFTCNNNLEKLNKDNGDKNNNGDKDNNGDKLKILLMKEYICDMKKYNWNEDNFNLLKSLLKQLFLSLYIAFKNFGFIHNNVHFGNFLLKKNKKDKILYLYNNENIEIDLFGFSIIIMDFENHLIDTNKKAYNIICKEFEKIINNIKYELNIIISNVEIINNYLSKYTELNLLHLLHLINNLEYEKLQHLQLSYNEKL